MSRRRLVPSSLLAALVLGALAVQAAEAPPIVYLDRARGWSIASGDGVHQSALAREIVRQAFLIAARDELRLATRDAWLGDGLPEQGENPPFDIACSAGEPSLLEVVRGFDGRQAAIWRQELKGDGKPLDYPRFVTRLEALSRGEFVAVLQRAGMSRNEASAAVAAVPASAAEIESWLNEMTFVPQFAALRELHSQIQARGESPRLLYQLARGYANLGVLSEYFWNPMHEAFKARGLLYAERFVVREKASPVSLACRGYVRAMLGLHAAALEDFSAAAARQQQPAASRKSLPAWMGLLEGFCRFDAAALKNPADPRYAPLSALLRLIAAEQSDTLGLVPRVAEAEVANAPQCYRIRDGFRIRYYEDPLSNGSREQRADEDFPLPLNGQEVLAGALYQQMQKLSDLPAEVRRLLAKGAAQRALATGNEPELRGKVILALLATASQPGTIHDGRPVAGPDEIARPNRVDNSEMPWSLLGQMIQEVSFYQAWRSLRPELHAQNDAGLARLLPTVPSHRYRGFLEMTRKDPTAHRKAYVELLQARDLEALSLHEHPIVNAITGLNQVEKARVLRKLRAAADDLPGDVALCMSFYEYGPDYGASVLSSVSPFAPMVRANLAKFAWKDVRPFAADWERTSATQPRVLAMLGQQLLNDGKLADAERLLKAALKLEPAAEALGDLAEVYRRQGNGSARLDALRRQLALPDLENREPTQTMIATYCMEIGDWKQAQQYADAAAQSNTAPGHLLAADVYEALQQWEQVEEHYRAIGQGGWVAPHGPEWLEWYGWCRRTGQGDATAAHRVALECERRRTFTQKLAPSNDKQRLVDGVFYLLLNDHEQARRRFDEGFAATHDPLLGLHAALCSDRLEDGKIRDERLAEIAKTQPLWLNANPAKPQARLYALAALLADDLSHGGKAVFDDSKLKALAAGGSEAELIDFYYFLGEYSIVHDQPKNALQAWRECVIRLPMRAPSRTLAGRGLWSASIIPATYRKDLQSRKAALAGKPPSQP